MSEKEDGKNRLDLSKKCLKKVPKQDDAQTVRVLILDDNELQKIDNIDSYLKIEKLSLSKNQLLRMYGVCRLHCLRELNLSFNGILTIEGLKELIHLTHLNLEGNNIKTIEHLNTNVKLEYLNLSENSIGSISDISFLKCLKELYLHGNRLTHLKLCDKYLPNSLKALTLAKNNIADLNEICTLSNLINLHSITINENPCVQMTGGTDGFDHRPFVLNWCMSVKVIDGYAVDPIESLKAEWLYSQGRGRQFRVGEQENLAKYLSSVCPMIGKALENENERKLRLILSKAQQHQRQLQEEISENTNSSGNNSPSSGRRKPGSRIQSPRFSRLSGRQGSPDSMSSSYHGNTSNSLISNDMGNNHLAQMTTSLIENIKNDALMTQSFDGTVNNYKSHNSSQESTPRTATPNLYNDHSHNMANTGGPLVSASKMVPVPETLMSPDCCPITTVPQRVTAGALQSQNQMTNIKSNKNKDHKNGSPKVIRSSHLKKNNERSSPTISPRKSNNIINNQISKSPLVDNHNQSVKNRNLSATSVHVFQADGSCTVSSDDDSDHINVDKLKTIRNKAAQRNQKRKENIDVTAVKLNDSTESSAIMIQKMWRGYRTRKKTKYIAEKILKARTQEYIQKLTKDMEITKAQLENERKIQQLQMQAINALWKKVSTMQVTPPPSSSSSTNNQNQQQQQNNISHEGDHQNSSSSTTTISLDNSSAAVVNDLAKTCSMLTNQVQQLQGSMRDILNCMTIFCSLPQEGLKKLLSNDDKDSSATQTEIIAVHTPQVEVHGNFPFKVRPSSLPLETSEALTKIETQNPKRIDEENNENEKENYEGQQREQDQKHEDQKQLEQHKQQQQQQPVIADSIGDTISEKVDENNKEQLEKELLNNTNNLVQI